MKKWIVVFLPLMWGICVFAQEATAPKAPVTAQAKQQPAKVQPVFESEKAAKKAFKQRRKQINKLVKKYRKASAEEKPAIRKELYQIVSEGMDLGLSSMKARIAQQKANLARWEEKLSESEARWDELKAQRVEDLLSGAAERKYKLAQKAWKQEMKDQKENMR